MNGPAVMATAAVGMVQLAALPSVSARRIAASVVLVIVVSALSGALPTIAWGIAGLLFVGALLTSGVPLIRRILD